MSKITVTINVPSRVVVNADSYSEAKAGGVSIDTRYCVEHIATTGTDSEYMYEQSMNVADTMMLMMPVIEAAYKRGYKEGQAEGQRRTSSCWRDALRRSGLDVTAEVQMTED